MVGMRKMALILILFCIVLILMVALILSLLTRNQKRPHPRFPTLTTLPPFPNIPLGGLGMSRQEKEAAREQIVNHKISTYPKVSSRSYRIGKFTSTGIFGGFSPTEDQIARI